MYALAMNEIVLFGTIPTVKEVADRKGAICCEGFCSVAKRVREFISSDFERISCLLRIGNNHY